MQRTPSIIDPALSIFGLLPSEGAADANGGNDPAIFELETRLAELENKYAGDGDELANTVKYVNGVHAMPENHEEMVISHPTDEPMEVNPLANEDTYVH